MISVEEALQKILQQIAVLDIEQVPILDSLGQVLAEDVSSNVQVPPLDNAAMDGFAVQAGDTVGAGKESPNILRVIGTVIAGSISKKVVTPGTAVRIMTGAPVPKGADSVIMFEDTDEEIRKEKSGNRTVTEIGVMCELETGANIRRAGEDIASGSVVLEKGIVIRPSEIGVLASVGRATVKVIRRPVIAVLATGNEVTAVNRPLPKGKIYNSNTYSISSLVKRYGAIPKILGIARDKEDALTAKLRQGLEADMVLTIGGVSMGDYDMVKGVLAKEGEMLFWKVRAKPGKPLAFGKLKGTDKNGREKSVPHLGLAGNPVSCMVNFELFVRPAIFKMMGKKILDKPTVTAVMEDSVKNKSGRRIYDRAVIEKRDGKYYARLTGPQGSGMLTSMSRANGLVIVPEDVLQVNKGDEVQAMMLDWNEEVTV